MIEIGRRYLTVSSFVSHCRDLNVGVDEDQLEYFEKERVLLPVARILQPDEFPKAQAKQKQNWYYSDVHIEGWDDLVRLLYGYGIDRRLLPGPLLDEQLIHPLDWEFEHGNRYLMQPAAEGFRPWDTYFVEVEDLSGNKHHKRTIETYYHYWQVYPVYRILKRFHMFASHPYVIQRFQEINDASVEFFIPQQRDVIASFNGMAVWFDALSYYIEMYTAEQARTFKNTHVLDNAQLENHRQRLENHAKLAVGRFQLNVADSYGFLLFLLDLHSELQREERTKLADMLENDLIFASRLITSITGKTVEAVEADLTERGVSYWARQSFRHLDKAVEIYDYARQTFQRLKDEYNHSFPTLPLNETEIDMLLSFVENAGLFILPFTIYDLDEAINSPKRFQMTSRYIALKNMTTGLECLLRELAKKAPKETGSLNTLESLVPIVFPSWAPDFQSHRDRRPHPTQPTDFAHNISDIYTDASLNTHPHGNALRHFLIAYWARNLTGHHYTLQDDLYGELYGIIYRAVFFSVCYSWLLSRQNGWV